MSPPEKAKGPAANRAPNTATITTTENSTVVMDWPVMSLTIPGHPLATGEADLRFTLNTLSRERPHWWLFTPAGAAQRELLERLGWWSA